MNVSPHWRILGVALIAVAALVDLVFQEARARAAGTEALFAMEAVDPRSLLSGHFVIVSLQRTLPKGAPCVAPPEPTNGDVAAYDHSGWIAIAAETPQARVVGLARSRKEAAALGPLTVRGSYRCTKIDPNIPDSSAQEFIDLGVDRFHINQREAERIDAILRGQTAENSARAFAIVSIGKDGRARLNGLQIDGKRLDLVWD